MIETFEAGSALGPLTVSWGYYVADSYNVYLYAAKGTSCILTAPVPLATQLASASGVSGPSVTLTIPAALVPSTSFDLCAEVIDTTTVSGSPGPNNNAPLGLTGGPASYVLVPSLSSYISNDESAVTIDLGQSFTLTDFVSGGSLPYSYQWYYAGTTPPATPPVCTPSATPVPGATESAYSPARPYAPTAAGTYYYLVEVSDSSINPSTTCESVTVTVNAPLTGTFTIDSVGPGGTINGQVGSPALQAVVTFAGGTGPWYEVTVYSGTDSLCSGDMTVVTSLGDITGTEALLSFPEPSAPSTTTYYCATITDSSGGSPVTYGPIQVNISPALGGPTLALSPTSSDYGQPPKIVTATVTWAGGTAPYTVTLLSGSSPTCASDNQPVVTLTPTLNGIDSGLTVTTVQFTFYSPPSTTYYCAKVVDSSVPPSVAESSDSPSTVEPLLAVNDPSLSATEVEQLVPLYEGNTITATVTWSGGSGPFNVFLYNATLVSPGSSPPSTETESEATCASTLPLVTTTPGSNPQTGVTGDTTTFSFLAPNWPGTYYYCVSMEDVTGNVAYSPSGSTTGTTLLVSPPIASPAVIITPTLHPTAPAEDDTGQTESATATVSWTGGNAPYTVTLYEGSLSSCTHNTAAVTVSSGSNPQSGLYGNTVTFVFVSPPTTTYYCATITDSSVPMSTASSVTGGVWTVVPPPSVSVTGGNPSNEEIAAGSSTTLTATIMSTGTGPDFLQWFLGPTCNPAYAITPVLPASAGSTYFTGVLTSTTKYSVQIIDSSTGTPATGVCLSNDETPNTTGTPTDPGPVTMVFLYDLLLRASVYRLGMRLFLPT